MVIEVSEIISRREVQLRAVLSCPKSWFRDLYQNLENLQFVLEPSRVTLLDVGSQRCFSVAFSN